MVTGGAGFIGSNFVHHRLAARPDDSIVVLDKLTYACLRDNLDGAPADRLEFIEGEIGDRETVLRAIEGCDAIINFAAESHVDRSIESPGEFIQTDVGTFILLFEAARDAGIRHLQIRPTRSTVRSTKDPSQKASPIEPSSPYSASKAGGDLIVGAFRNTYGNDALIVRASNNYGPRQHPEKLIPLVILNALHRRNNIPVYGDGQQVRNWLFVEDFCSAIGTVVEDGEAGEVYNVGGSRRDYQPGSREAHPRADLQGRIADHDRRGPPRP